MDKIIYTLVTYIISSAIFCSCSHESSHIQQRIETAVNVMDERPDSALEILDSIAPSEIKTEKLFARYALYLTQARHKNYIDETSDSLIRKATAYFDTYESSNHYEQMLSHYYCGIILMNSDNYAPAIANLIKAQDISKACNQSLWLGRAQTQIAKIYSKIYAKSEAVKYDSLACETFRNSDDSINLRYGNIHLATSLYNAQRHNDALQLATKIYKDAIDRSDTIFMGEAFDIMGRSNHRLKDYAKALHHYDKYLTLCPQNSSPRIYSLYIDALWKNGNRDKALEYMNYVKIRFGDNAELPDEFLYEIGDYKNAYQQLLKIYNETDSTLGEIIRQNVYNTVDEYHRNEIAKMELVHQNDAMKMTGLMLLSVISGIAAALFVRHTRLEQKRSDERIMSLANELESLLKGHDDDPNAANEPTEASTATNDVAPQFSISRRHLDTIRVLCETYYESNQKESIKSRTAQEAEREIKDFVNTPDFHTFLEYLADTENGNIMKRFRQQMPGLSDKEYHIFVCSALRLPVPVILMFFDLNRNTLYTTRRRMRQKISDTHPADEREFLNFL